jgi:hypothetical protein
MEPLLYDLSPNFGNKRDRNKRIRAYEAAWARLQHEEPGYAADPDDQRFERVLLDWLRFHRGMLIGEIIPQVYQYLRDNPAAPELHLYDHSLVDEYQDLNRAEQGVIDLIRNTASLCIVGDDYQSLYSFKFAHPAGIRTFPDSHPGTTDQGGLGARSLNIELQKELNPPGVVRIERFGWTFCPGDKVMQVENDYDRDVYNGDLGVVLRVDMEEGELAADFDGREITYGFGELDELVLAYATTIHESTRTTKLYDRTKERLTDEVKRIRL